MSRATFPGNAHFIVHKRIPKRRGHVRAVLLVRHSLLRGRGGGGGWGGVGVVYGDVMT